MPTDTQAHSTTIPNHSADNSAVNGTSNGQAVALWDDDHTAWGEQEQLPGTLGEDGQEDDQTPVSTVPMLDFARGPVSAFGLPDGSPDFTTVEFPWTDEGNARACKALFGSYFCYVDAWGWRVFTGTHWARENAEHHIKHAMVRTLRIREG